MRSRRLLAARGFSQFFSLVFFSRATVGVQVLAIPACPFVALAGPALQPVTRLQAGLDYPHRANAFSDLDRTACHPVVRADNVNLVAALHFSNCGLGDKQSVFVDADYGAGLSVLPRPQDVFRIREEARQLNGSVFWSTWRLANQNRPGFSYVVPSARISFTSRRSKCVGARQAEILLLADGEVVPDRIDRRNTRYSAARGADQVAHLDSSTPAMPSMSDVRRVKLKVHLGIFKRALRRDDACARGLNLCPGRLHLGLRGIYLRHLSPVILPGIIQTLLSGCMLREQRYVTVFIQLCPDLSGFAGRKIRFRRGESRLRLSELCLCLLHTVRKTAEPPPRTGGDQSETTTAPCERTILPCMSCRNKYPVTCALMSALTRPSSVPIHSRSMGKSRCSTAAVRTSGGGGGLAGCFLLERIITTAAPAITAELHPFRQAEECAFVSLVSSVRFITCGSGSEGVTR